MLNIRTKTQLEMKQLLILIKRQTLGFPCDSAIKESTCNAGDLGLIPELGRSPGEGKGYPLQYSGLENSMDCIVHGVTKSWTRLNAFHFTSQLNWQHGSYRLSLDLWVSCLLLLTFSSPSLMIPGLVEARYQKQRSNSTQVRGLFKMRDVNP